MFLKKKETSQVIEEENIKIPIFGEKISKELKVFYNPVMKLNRDLSLLVIKNFFDNPIHFCDPMGASGVRELRFQKTIPEMFESLTIGDISKTAIKIMKKNFKYNKLKTKNIIFLNQEANNTILKRFYHYIEVDPFGSPVPFLDSALQRIKHESILSVTATDTAALCGTYPKTTLRKYNILVQKTLWYEELGLRNLIAYCQIQAAKYNIYLEPLISYSSDHYYKIFFKTNDSKNESLKAIKDLKYIKIDSKTQQVSIEEYQNKDSLGKTYVKDLNNKEFIQKILNNIELVKDNKKVKKLLENLKEELEIVGSYNIHKLQKEFEIKQEKKFKFILEELKKNNYNVCRPHNNRFSIKTNAKPEEIVKILKKE